MPRRWIDVLKSFSRKRSHDSPRMCSSCLLLSAKFSTAGGSSKPRLSQTNLAITFHITAFCHRYQFGLNEDRFNDILWWNCAKLLANIAIHRLFMGSLDKSCEETFAAKVRVDDFITGIWNTFPILQRETFFFVYDGQSPRAISNTPLQRLPRQKKVHQSTTRRLVFRVPCLSHYRRY